ncbi:MAG: hypothetical protein IPP39_04140 [Chitinophagaceae bacterium]|nr:hypothetical protein [Chitinophagaceae bacterium]
MKKICILFLLLAGLTTVAQVKVPAEVAQRLQGNKNFSDYAREMMQYVTSNQSRFPVGSRERTYFEKQEKFLARQLWYLEGRQDANGDIADYTRKTFTAVQQYETGRAAQRVEATAYGSWSIVGPTNITTSATTLHTGIGRVDRIAFHPTDPDVIFAGTPAGGVFKSNNGGDNWFNLNSYMPSLGVSGLVVSWADANDIYVLTGDGDSNIGDNGFVQGFDYIRPSIGVLKSTDGGVTWQRTGDFGLAGFYVGYKLVQSPTNANVLIAATSQGLFRTANGGTTWTLVSSNSNRYYDIEWKPGSSTTVYACTAGRFYISTDAGANFTASNLNFDFTISSGERTAIAVTPANANYVFVFTNNDGTNIGVFRSTNSGASFTRRNNSNTITSGTASYMHNLTVASDNVNIVLTGGLEIYRSTDGASNFSLSNQRGNANQPDYAHDDIHELVYNPLDNTLYAGADGGVYKSNDDGVTYVAKYTGMTNTQYYHFDVSDADENYMFGGAQDNGGHYRNGATSTFLHTIKGDGYDVRFYNGATSQLYLSVNKSLYRSNATLTDWTEMPGMDADWYKTVAISYSNNNIVFASSDPVYRTINGGTGWVNVGANGRWALVTCPSNSNRVYAAGGDSWNDGGTQGGKKLFRSDDQGDTWVELQENTGFPETITKITGIGVDPGNSLRLWVTMGGFTDGEKVYYSNNGGDTWSNLSGSIPNIPVNCITIDANLDAYIGTDAGVFFKSALMPDWQPFYNFLPRVPVTELHIRNGTIYASTFGRGIWKSDTHGDCPASLNFPGNLQSVRFYEAVIITSSGTLTAGAGTQIFLRAENYVSLTEGFLANASTGESFRAWIGNCASGGIPTMRNSEINAWQAGRTNSNSLSKKEEDNKIIYSVNMPFDGKASLLLLDGDAKPKEVFLLNKMLKKGMNEVTLPKSESQAGRLVLFIDGQLKGVVE